MFRKWLENHSAVDYDLTTALYPPASDRGFWDGIRGSEYINSAELYRGCEWPVIRATQYMELKKSGNRRAQENPHFARRTALYTLVMGEIAEHKRRFLPDIIDGIFAICEETFWGVSAHIGGMPAPGDESVIDLFAAETASLLAITCHMLKDELDTECPSLIPRVEQEIRRRIFDSYIDNTSSPWMGYSYPVNNWTPWIISNLLTVYLIFEKNKAVLSRAVDKMLYEINTIYSTIPDDGGCDEGACYWAVSGGCLFEFCDQLYVASGGKINFFSDEKLHRICQFEYRVYLGGGYFANFADGTPKVTHSMVGLLYVMGLRFGDERFTALAGDLNRNESERNGINPAVERDAKIKRRLYEMIYTRDIEAAPGVNTEQSEFFGRTGIAIVRKGDWCIAAKGGHNSESHNHNDVGSFIAYFDSTPVLVDPSCGTYTSASFGGGRYDLWTNNSGWHNVPEINGQLQPEGKEYRADSFALEENTVKVSFAGAYPGDTAKSVCRVVSVDSTGVHLRDSFVLSGAVTERFITPLTVRIDGDGVIIGEKYILRCDTPGEVLSDSVDFEGDEKLTLYWKTDSMNRIGFRFAADDHLEVGFTLERIG